MLSSLLVLLTASQIQISGVKFRNDSTILTLSDSSEFVPPYFSASRDIKQEFENGTYCKFTRDTAFLIRDNHNNSVDFGDLVMDFTLEMCLSDKVVGARVGVKKHKNIFMMKIYNISIYDKTGLNYIAGSQFDQTWGECKIKPIEEAAKYYGYSKQNIVSKIKPRKVNIIEKSECIKIPNTEYEACLYRDKRLVGNNDSKYWRSGQDEIEFLPAELKIYLGRSITSSISLAPLSRISLDTYSGKNKYLYVTEDNTASMGSYSGLQTRILSFNNRKIQFEQLVGGDELILTSTGKSDWKEITNGFLRIKCSPVYDTANPSGDLKFKTEYIRLWPSDSGWCFSTATRPEMWESDSDPDSSFNEKNFPNIGSKSVSISGTTDTCDSIDSVVLDAQYSEQIIDEDMPVYPETALINGTESVVEVLIKLNKQGVVSSVDIITSGGDTFDTSVTRAVYYSKFKPLIKSGCRYQCKIRKSFNFKI